MVGVWHRWLAVERYAVRAGRRAARTLGMLPEYPDLLPVIDSFNLSRVREAIRVVREARRAGKVLLAG